jgi:hypothetical protein
VRDDFDARGEVVVVGGSAQDGYEVVRINAPGSDPNDVSGIELTTSFPFEDDSWVWRFNNTTDSDFAIHLVVRCLARRLTP